MKKQLKLKGDIKYNMEKSKSFKEKIQNLNSLTSGFLQDEPIITINKIKKSIDIKSKPQRRRVKEYVQKTFNEDKGIDIEKDSVLSVLNNITHDNWYTINPSNGKKRIDTFYHSVAMNIDDNFVAYKNRERDVYIKTLKHKMAVDLIEQNLYRLYQYHHIRTFKKSTLEEDLIENRGTDVTKRYLSDYLDINILCIDKKTHKSYLYRDTYYKTLSIILFIETDGTFKPMLSSSGNHFIHPDVFQDVIKKYPISRYTLSDLQKIAEDYDIPLHNIRELKSGEKRLKNKTKRELYDLISEKAT